MSVDPGSPNYATADLLRAAAVQDVDIKAQGPNGETSGKALVVAVSGGSSGSGSVTVGGEGTPGAPSGGVVTVQGADGGTPLATVAPAATWTDRSGTIAAAGVSQELMPANPNRRGFWVQNLSAEDLYIMDGAPATPGQPSIKIVPEFGLYETPAHGCPVTAINIVGATLGSAFSAREF